MKMAQTDAGIAVPAYLAVPKKVAEVVRQDTDEVDEAALREKLPKPVGYKVLLMLPKQAEAYESGILKSEATMKGDEAATVVAYVVNMGKDAYTDAKRFPNGAYCKVGDWVLIRPYSGTRFQLHGQEMRLVNDESIEAVVEDPRGLTRIGG